MEMLDILKKLNHFEAFIYQFDNKRFVQDGDGVSTQIYAADYMKLREHDYITAITEEDQKSIITAEGRKYVGDNPEVYRPHWVEPDYMKSIGYELVSDVRGYLKYESKWAYGPVERRGTKYESVIGNGKRIIYVNCTFSPEENHVYLGVREDGDSRSVFGGICRSSEELVLILDLVR